jgi:hypothetical protein
MPASLFASRESGARAVLVLVALMSAQAGAHEVLPDVEVLGRADPLTGRAFSASEGVVGREQLDARPLLRPGEILETVPGLIATQHSGAGKGNQFFLRGFNLDHGTDFASFVNGVPLNLPTHAHGQGYTDLNFLIPELVNAVRFRKGPYASDVGDFGSAGAVNLLYGAPLEQGFASFTGGSFDFARIAAADTFKLPTGQLTVGIEGLHDDGPWEQPQDFRKLNLLGDWRFGDAARGGGLQLQAYGGDWTATDQIARRAPIDRFGTLDPTSGGDSYRIALTFDWHRHEAERSHEVTAYAVAYGLDLFSNFTYLLASPQGDQFEQRDRRLTTGLNVTEGWHHRLFGRSSETRLGLQFRNDLIDNGLYQTIERRRTDKLDHDGNVIAAVTREDEVLQSSLGLFLQQRIALNDWMRAEAGIRGDVFRFDVDSSNPLNSGTELAARASPKGSLVFGPWRDAEAYLSAGLGFHSNDARGVTARVDPVDGVTPVAPVDRLVESRGGEVGFRFTPSRLQSTLAFWWLELDSELVYIGDAGNTEAGRPSRRHGVEWTNFWTPLDWLTLDADFAFTHARFSDSDPGGDRIPGAVGTVIASGISVDGHPWLPQAFGALRLRYFGPRALIEDNSARSEQTLLLNLLAGYRITQRAQLSVQVFNLLGREDDDITYFYPSRLPGEAAGPSDGGFDDFHFHPVEPRAARVVLQFAL